MCQRDNNQTIEQTTAKGQQQAFSWPQNKYVYKFSDNKCHTKLQIVRTKLKLKIIND